MTSLVERLRVRSESKPNYNLDDSDDDFCSPPEGRSSGRVRKKDGPERFVREDAKEDECQICGEPRDLVSCSTCTYSYHSKCLLPGSKLNLDDQWSCPECVSPLLEIEKILDCETRHIDCASSSHQSGKRTSFKHYLVKWKGLSYLHCSWIPETEFIKASKTHSRVKIRLNNFKRQMELIDKSDDDSVPIRPEWTTVDRVLACREANSGDGLEYYVKWKDLPYDECSWESESSITAFQNQIDRFNIIQSKRRKKSSNKPTSISREMHAYDKTPDFLSGGTLHPYQLEGLNFLLFSWLHNRRVVLADEMGLGKTIQSIAFLASLFEENISPHLVVAPLSTLRNWEREFTTWAPQMNVIMYFGSAQARDIIKMYEFYYPKEKSMKQTKKKKKKASQSNNQMKKQIKFDVLLTSYEMINMDSSVLKHIEWQCMIVDEGHRLKNKDSKLFAQLKDYPSRHRVLLTGTPIQNNLDELFMLMHFLEGDSFGSLADLQEEFKDINQDNQIEKLHEMLKPHLLRRFKKDVMKELPPKKELILRVELTSKQKEYYKAILTRNYEVLARRAGAQISLNNVVMELRKLCCHAYMLEGVEPEIGPSDPEEGLRQLLDASGKLQLFDKMMVKLREQGHRVLVYSQFQHMLDLLEDYLSYKKWSYERIDGKIGGADRQIRIDRFNAKNSGKFCFLLSTRAGGLGINLATADTVIIYDSDWNPHADLQAMARAHRLGQTSKVMIYRLVCRGTIEERMMQLTKKKMVLEHLIVGRLKAQSVNQEELDDIIRYGSKELFDDDNEEAAKACQIHYDDAAIDRLLNREESTEEEALDDEDENDFLKGFKVANFEYVDETRTLSAKDDENNQTMADKTSNSERINYWDDLLKDRYEVQKVEEHTTMGKGKRSRKQMAAAGDDDALDISSDDEDYSLEDDDISDNDENVHTSTSAKRAQNLKKKRSEWLPLMEGEGRSLRVLGFNQLQRSTFSQMVMRFGLQEDKYDEFLPRLKGKSIEDITNYAKLFMKHILEDSNESLTFSDGVPKEDVQIDEVLIRISIISLIEAKVEHMSNNPKNRPFPKYIYMEHPSLRNGRLWRDEHDVLLLKAVLKHGYAKWQPLVDDSGNGIAEIVRCELNLPPADVVSDSAQTSNGTHGMVYSFREIQRRIVDFIKKRYQLLEKAISLEHGVKMANIDIPEDYGEEIRETEFQEKHSPKEADMNSLLEELPDIEPFPINEANSINVDAGHVGASELYNKMCSVIRNADEDALRSHLGDRNASFSLCRSLQELETICEDMKCVFKGSSGAPNTEDTQSSDSKGKTDDPVVTKRGTENERSGRGTATAALAANGVVLGIPAVPLSGVAAVGSTIHGTKREKGSHGC